MKAAVFSHGRSSFVYTAGRLCSHRQEYDITAGSGNGALLAAFAACGEYDMLHEFIDMTKNEEFYMKSPIIGGGNVSLYEMFMTAFRRRMLRRSISNVFAPYFNEKLSPLYYKMMTENKSLFLSIYNAAHHQVEIKKIPKDIAFDRFAQFMLASISHPMVFPNVKVGKHFYRSAAMIEPLPVNKILDLGVTDIDIYTNLPNGSLDSDPNESPYYSLQLLDDNSRYLQLKELKTFLSRVADNRSIRYRIFFTPICFNDAETTETVDVNKYFDKGYIASDVLHSFKG